MAKGEKKHSRLSPKRSGKDAAESADEICRDLESVRLTYTQQSLEGMVIEGILPNQVTGGWRRAAGEAFPTPDTNEPVVFEAYFVRGFGIPTHPFLRKLLRYYSISLCHLNPNSILHISLFINLCEAFIGIALHFNLFRHFFCLKPFFGSGSPKVIDGVYLQLRNGMVKEYIQVPLKHIVEGVEC
jgi:hypothetical protein